jgi:hypothetical protein
MNMKTEAYNDIAIRKESNVTSFLFGNFTVKPTIIVYMTILGSFI